MNNWSLMNNEQHVSPAASHSDRPCRQQDFCRCPLLLPWWCGAVVAIVVKRCVQPEEQLLFDSAWPLPPDYRLQWTQLECCPSGTPTGASFKCRFALGWWTWTHWGRTGLLLQESERRKRATETILCAQKLYCNETHWIELPVFG